MMRSALLAVLAAAALVQAGESASRLFAFPGKTPTIDGVLTRGEWDDATQFYGTTGWTHTFNPVKLPKDLSVHGYVKHDGRRLYFAFDVTDDVLYGIDTPRWLPKENPKAHELTPDGYPWFGDEVELLINGTNHWTGAETAAGNATSWQMVANLTKSRLGGIGTGGLLEGEPRDNTRAWSTYRRWIVEHHQEAVAKVKTVGKGYIVEWAVDFNPCIEISSGRYWSPEMGDRVVGLNIAVGDLDEPEKGAGMFANFNHEEWFAGGKNTRTQLRQWGTLTLMSGRKATGAPKKAVRRSSPTRNSQR